MSPMLPYVLLLLALLGALPLAGQSPQSPETSKDPALPLPLDPVEKAVETYATQGRAPVLDQEGIVLFPYGLSEPAINCAPGILCDLELQAGEALQGIAVGDPTWVTEQLTSGESTPHVVLQPKAFGSSTTLIVTTGRRTYVVALTADHSRPVTHRAAFYYPRDVIRLAREHQTAEQRRAGTVIAEIADPSRLNFDYRIARDRWAPDRVFDDGTHTFVGWSTKPPAETPVLLGVDDSGKRTLLNYRVSRDGSWYIVDAVVHGLELKLGKKTLAIENRSRR
ncbi:MAG TPA: TrbG/VirB9 family P-type conjugative transfer protein [Thermoanaerobaculia bacterium]|nr:TrbG/VirB9 family P-type conjugative transfer protein [Thermoanaerobaculia bacterium]